MVQTQRVKIATVCFCTKNTSRKTRESGARGWRVGKVLRGLEVRLQYRLTILTFGLTLTSSMVALGRCRTELHRSSKGFSARRHGTNGTKHKQSPVIVSAKKAETVCLETYEQLCRPIEAKEARHTMPDGCIAFCTYIPAAALGGRETVGSYCCCCCRCSHINSLTKESVVTQRCWSPRKNRKTKKKTKIRLPQNKRDEDSAHKLKPMCKLN